jgi:hypothetical protein
VTMMTTPMARGIRAGRRERVGIGIRRSRYVFRNEMAVTMVLIGFLRGELCSWRRNGRLRIPAAGRLRIQTPTLPRPTRRQPRPRPRPRPPLPRTPSSTTQTRPFTSPTLRTRSRSKTSDYNPLRRSVPLKPDITVQERAMKMKTRWAKMDGWWSRARGGR